MQKPLACLMALWLTGCASLLQGYSVEPGTPRDAVLARFGPPGRSVPLPSGERLQYSLQPAGRAAWMIDLDSSGKVLQSRQVLNARSFERIGTGSWTRDDVEREFGRPAWVDRVALWDGPVMNYRWYENGNNMLYHVYLDSRNVVQRAHPTMEIPSFPRLLPHLQ